MWSLIAVGQRSAKDAYIHSKAFRNARAALHTQSQYTDKDSGMPMYAHLAAGEWNTHLGPLFTNPYYLVCSTTHVNSWQLANRALRVSQTPTPQCPRLSSTPPSLRSLQLNSFRTTITGYHWPGSLCYAGSSAWPRLLRKQGATDSAFATTNLQRP